MNSETNEPKKDTEPGLMIGIGIAIGAGVGAAIGLAIDNIAVLFQL